MQTLELLYQREFKNLNIIPRKLTIQNDKTIIQGPRGSGKSYMLYEFLSTLEYGSYLYIDFEDFRVQNISKEKLDTFIDSKNITTLLLDNFDFSFIPSFIPTCIITTAENQTIDDYEVKTLYPLNFEEFLSFEKRFVNEKTSFNNFTTNGTFPFVLSPERGDIQKNFVLLLSSMFPDKLEFEIVKRCSLKQGSLVTLLGLYKEIKQTHKVSKDKFYALVKKLQTQHVIFLIEAFGKKSHSKKLYMIDFAIRGVVSFEKDFIKRLENIVFLELLKQNKRLFYHDRVDFVIEDEHLAVTTMAFTPMLQMQNRIKLLIPYLQTIQIQKIQIITLELEFTDIIEDIQIEVLPFWSFALSC